MIAALLVPLFLASCSTSRIDVRATALKQGSGALGAGALAKGRMLFDRGEYALAVDAFRQAVRYAPGSADALNGLAVSYDHLGRYDLSQRYYQLALAVAPEDGRILRNLARSMLRQGDRLGAQRAMAEAAALDAPSVDALSQAPGGAGNTEEAVISGVGSVTVALAGTQPVDMPQVATPAGWTPVAFFRRALAHAGLGASPYDGGVSVAIVPPSDVAPERAGVQVVNAVGRHRQAARMRAWLGEQGWSPVTVRDTRVRLDHSRIVYGARARANAHALSRHLPFQPAMERSGNGHDVILMLGRDALPFDDSLRMPPAGRT